MFRLSRLADYGAVVMVYLAREQGHLRSAREISAKTHLPLPTVSKLLKILSGARLLTSVRGVAGGYRLAREPQAINLADIISALEEKHGLVDCVSQNGGCALESVCFVQDKWRVISKVIEQSLAGVSLASLANLSPMSEVA